MLFAGERPQPSSMNAPVVEPLVKPVTLDNTPSVSSNTNIPASQQQMKPPSASEIQHIWVVTGPAGCGKSTVGRVIQEELQVPFLEGDDVSIFSRHTTNNIYIYQKQILTRIYSSTALPTAQKWARESPLPTKTAGTG